MAYASDSLALATLEVLVHLKDATVLPAYSVVAAEIPDGLIEEIDFASLSADWRADPAPPVVQEIGDSWVRAGRSLALRVPSVIAPDSWNVLINPQHSAFRRLKAGDPLR